MNRVFVVFSKTIWNLLQDLPRMTRKKYGSEIWRQCEIFSSFFFRDFLVSPRSQGFLLIFFPLYFFLLLRKMSLVLSVKQTFRSFLLFYRFLPPFSSLPPMCTSMDEKSTARIMRITKRSVEWKRYIVHCVREKKYIRTPRARTKMRKHFSWSVLP